MERVKRLRLIVNVLNAQVIENQLQLTKALRLQGVDVTQATLSRDLKDLRAEKKVMEDGNFKYVVPSNPVVEKRVLGIDSDLMKMSTLSLSAAPS